MRYSLLAVTAAVLQCFSAVHGQATTSTASAAVPPASTAPPSPAPSSPSSLASTSVSSTPNTAAGSGTSSAGSSTSSSKGGSSSSSRSSPPPLPPPRTDGPPDVHLSVPTLSVKKIEVDVDNLSAEINLNANVANLVSVNAGVAVSIRKVNLTIADVGAELELNVRLGHLVDIVNRVFQSLDLNPLLITAINNVTSVLETTVGAVEGLLGSIARGDSTLNILIDNLGNIVQQVVGTAGQAVNTIVGDWQTNMTYTGKQQTLSGGLTQKTYSYSPLNALVNIVFNAANQIVSATVVKADNQAGGGNKGARGGGGGGSQPAKAGGGQPAQAGGRQLNAQEPGGRLTNDYSGQQGGTPVEEGPPPVGITPSIGLNLFS